MNGVHSDLRKFGQSIHLSYDMTNLQYFFEACGDWPQIQRLSMSVSQFVSILLHLILSHCDNMEMRQVSMEESLPMHACTCFHYPCMVDISCRGPNCCLYPISI